VTVVGVPQDLVAGDIYAEAGVTLPRQLGPDDPLLSEFFGRYPALRDWQRVDPTTPITAVQGNDRGLWDVTVRLAAPNNSDHDLRRRSVFYRGGLYAFPTIADGMTIHPSLSWWQILISLSMLARYQPNEWFTLIEVDKHQDAVPIESILTFCQQTLPEIALRGIEDAAGEPLLAT
jgi:hypothetical protein